MRPDIVPVHGSGPVDLARTTKDEAEIVQMRQNSLINDQVMAGLICCRRSNRKLSGGAITKFLHGADGEGDSGLFGANGAVPTTAGIRLNKPATV